MPTQINLRPGGEPTETKLLTLGHEKGGFRKIVFCCDGEKEFVI
jgi:hypothetical protein